MSNDKDPLNDLLSDLDSLDTVQAKTPQKRNKRGKGVTEQFRSALAESQTDRRQTAQATGRKSSVAGNFIRRSFTYRPDQLDSIEQLSQQLRLSKNDLIRWFVDMGVEAVGQGVEPPTTAEVRHRYNPNG